MGYTFHAGRTFVLSIILFPLGWVGVSCSASLKLRLSKLYPRVIIRYIQGRRSGFCNYAVLVYKRKKMKLNSLEPLNYTGL